MCAARTAAKPGASTRTAGATAAADVLSRLSDVQALAVTVYGEARNETPDGQIAVAQVVLHRLRRGRWGRTVRDVVGARLQFSCWWPAGGRQNFERVLQVAEAVAIGAVPDSLRQCLWIADGVLSGQVTRDLVQGATHYLTADLLRTDPPAWTRGASVLAHVGAHVFLRPVGE